jgi:hypothetical protein
LAGSSGFFATSTFFGAFIIVRIAAASSSAALRRLARSAARCFSSFSIVPALTTRSAGLTGSASGRLGFGCLRLGGLGFRGGGRERSGGGRGSGFGGGLGGRFPDAQLGGLALGAFLRLAAALLLLQLFFLDAQALGLGMGLFLAAAEFRLVRLGRGRILGRSGGVVALDEGALLAHLDLDGAGLAARIGLLDLAGRLARQRDLLALDAGAAPCEERR